MSKKSTKVAYLVAIAIIVALLAFLGISYAGGTAPEGYTTPIAGTFWSLLPPIVAIGLALISKEVYSSLFLGCLVGALLVANFNPWNTVVTLVGGDYGLICNVGDSWNIGILIFLVILGIMVDLMNKGGGSAAFGRWATKSVKTRCGAQLMSMLLGILIFIDDYFN
ncbi:MAG: Na+/H+ antiporter NhaC family protein, partial [Oscillospiraceae bacterium]|nr:Na+/H+ antiporter NhaC family protein [Oscillospiraceae bacterium]